MVLYKEPDAGNGSDDFPQIESVVDCCGRRRRFTVDLHTTDGGYFVRATEQGNGTEGYEFAAHSEASPYLALGRLRQKIAEGLSRRYLAREDGHLSLSHGVAIGRIGYGGVVIDGEMVSFDELAVLLQSYEGWQVSLKIADPYDPM